MGTILFYIFESTLCLTILYFLFRLFFRKDTLFRTNRFLLLAGTMACTLLPLLQIDVPQYTTLQLPITTVRHLLTEKEIDVQREGGTGEKHLSEEASLLMTEKGGGYRGRSYECDSYYSCDLAVGRLLFYRGFDSACFPLAFYHPYASAYPELSCL